ncbi:MAG: hypothetical protein FWC43_12245 [Planctomycetaceae bacterium]|nr:hypothetical protein [Planctomycetaceae bacterium]
MQMERDAIHWPRYLDNRFKGMAPEDAVKLLSQITLTPELFGTTLAQLPCSPQTEAMRKVAKRHVQPCNIKVGRYEVFEEAAGLFRKAPKQKSPTFVCDVKCFLDELFHNSKRTRKLYRGRILYRGETLGFTAKVRDFDKNPIAVIRANIEDAGLPDPTFHCKDRFLREVIFKMSRLKKIVPARSIGWNDETQAFVFPQFRVKANKIIRTTKHALWSGVGFPCKYVEPPDETYNFGTEWLPCCTEIAPFLSAATLIAMRPCLGLPSFPVVVSSDDLLWPLADSLGLVIANLYEKDHLKSLRKYNAQHRWPILVPYDLEADRVKLCRLNLEDFRHTLFHIRNSSLAHLFAESQANIIHIPLKESKDAPVYDWQILFPTIKRIFFKRLQELLRNKPQVLSDKAFLDRETAYWIAEFTRSVSQPDHD